ncbi:hypothetical protein SDC9_185605 [bioreactor metagenome]|uniref:Uncharacterized protein n=1 Tax=bioreactor metagenome TaxID=1076179 RepID=A0A645HI61_9ZZZZ
MLVDFVSKHRGINRVGANVFDLKSNLDVGVAGDINSRILRMHLVVKTKYGHSQCQNNQNINNADF